MIDKREKELMMHALGIESWDLRKKRIKPYRNYFGTAVHDEIWERLFGKGLATKSSPTFFHVSVKGLSELSSELGVHIYSDCSRCVGDARYPVFKAIVDNDVAIDSNWHPISCKSIARAKRIPLSLVRETTKFLCEEGMIAKDHIGGQNDGKVYCFHGYSVTEKGKEHPYYKEAYEKSISQMNEFLLRK